MPQFFQYQKIAKYRQKHQSLQKQRGMTLLEILVVLVIIGLAVSTAAPPMFRVLDSVSFKTQTEEIVGQITTLKLAALLEQRNLRLKNRTNTHLDKDRELKSEVNARSFINNENKGSPTTSLANQTRRVNLPKGWTMEGDDIVFLKTGVCLGGKVILKAPSGRAKTFIFKAPDCEIADTSIR